MREPHRPCKLALLGLAGAVAFGGCAYPANAGHSGVIHVAIEEYRLVPSAIRARTGLVDIYVRNFGRLTHNFVVSSGGQTTGATRPLAPGESAELALDLAPGRYSISSTLLSDSTLGTNGTLTVTP